MFLLYINAWTWNSTLLKTVDFSFKTVHNLVELSIYTTYVHCNNISCLLCTLHHLTLIRLQSNQTCASLLNPFMGHQTNSSSIFWPSDLADPPQSIWLLNKAKQTM